MPIIRNIIQPIIRPIISGITGAIRRVFITLDPVANAYYELASPWTPTGDFEIEFDFVTTATSEGVLIAGDITTASRIYTDTGSGNLVFKVLKLDTTSQFIVVNTLSPDGKLHKATASKVGDLFSLTVDGTTATSTIVNPTNFEVSGFGSLLGVNRFFDGIISNVRLTDLSTPSNSESYALNQLTGDIEFTGNNVFGSELVTNGDFATDSDWTKPAGVTISGGKMLFSSVANTLRNAQTIPVVAGDTIAVTFTISDITQGGLRVRFPFTSASFTTNGVHTAVGIADSSGEISLQAQGDTTLSLDNVSVKQITNAITYVMIAETIDTRDTFTLVDEGWTGSELVVNGSFDTDTAWTKDPLASGVPWVIAGGDASISGAQTSATDIFQTPAMIQDREYLFAFDILNISVGVTLARTGGLSIPDTTFTTVGRNTITTTLTGVSSPIAFRCTAGQIAAIDNVSVKQLIEVA